MDLYDRIRVKLTLALLLVLATLTEHSFADNNHTSSAGKPTSHLIWTRDGNRYDFVFNSESPLENLVKLESDPGNYITTSLSKCTNYSACLFKDGTHLESFRVNNDISHESIFTTAQETHSNSTSSGTQCDIGNQLKIVHYCSTHWTVPVYLTRSGCFHIIEWHSPLRCHSDSVNHEHPCYTYDPNGKLIDLTSWIKSDGSSYAVDIGQGNISKVKNFNVNICNEAHDACGPNVSSCYVDEQAGLIESGYNNLTSIRYDTKDNVTMLTLLGQHKKQCEGDRIKTVIRFTCKKKTSSQTRPRLIRSSACESVIEWSTVKACPVSEVSQPATECKIKYEPLGFDINIMKLTDNRNMITVPDINLDGKKKKMVLSICKGIPRSMRCEGKSVATTNACLFDASSNSTVMPSDSQIVGSVTKSTIRLSDDRIYLESFAPNKTCSESIRPGVNITQRIGTKLEFFCSQHQQKLPNFIGYDDCTYVFEWGTPLMCFETLQPSSNKTEKSDATKHVPLQDQVRIPHVNLKNVIKSESRKEQIVTIKEKPTRIPVANSTPAMKSSHKYFMISLILMSFVAFIVIIFVLDKKTRLRVTLRQARQAFQPNQQPYSRVVNDLDL